VERRGSARNRLEVRWYYGIMRRPVLASLALLSTLSTLGVAGCGLISSDVAEIPFDLPERMYSFDSAMFPVPAGITAAVPCGAGTPITDCCNPPTGPIAGCMPPDVACEQNENGMSFCTATVPVSQSQTMNLGMEVSKLSGYTGFVNIKVKRISYVINTNTLNVNLPDVGLYLGPQGATKFDDAGVVQFGTLPAIPAGTTTTGDVMLVSNSSGVLAMFTSDIKKPFSFIAATTVKATQSPTGKIDLTIKGQLAISP